MTTRKTTAKPKRTPVSGNRDILTVDQKKGYVYRWVNDLENRIQKHVDAGYVFVKSDGDFLAGEKSVNNAKATTSGVISKNVGKGMTAYLMAQKEEWFEEDQRAKMERIDRAEKKMTKASGKDEYGEVKFEVRNGSMSAPRVGKL